jgi:hypothetical protein
MDPKRESKVTFEKAASGEVTIFNAASPNGTIMTINRISLLALLNLPDELLARGSDISDPDGSCLPKIAFSLGEKVDVLLVLTHKLTLYIRQAFESSLAFMKAHIGEIQSFIDSDALTSHLVMSLMPMGCVVNATFIIPTPSRGSTDSFGAMTFVWQKLRNHPLEELREVANEVIKTLENRFLLESGNPSLPALEEKAMRLRKNLTQTSSITSSTEEAFSTDAGSSLGVERIWKMMDTPEFPSLFSDLKFLVANSFSTPRVKRATYANLSFLEGCSPEILKGRFSLELRNKIRKNIINLGLAGTSMTSDSGTFDASLGFDETPIALLPLHLREKAQKLVDENLALYREIMTLAEWVTEEERNQVREYLQYGLLGGILQPFTMRVSLPHYLLLQASIGEGKTFDRSEIVERTIYEMLTTINHRQVLDEIVVQTPAPEETEVKGTAPFLVTLPLQEEKPTVEERRPTPEKTLPAEAKSPTETKVPSGKVPLPPKKTFRETLAEIREGESDEKKFERLVTSFSVPCFIKGEVLGPSDVKISDLLNPLYPTTPSASPSPSGCEEEPDYFSAGIAKALDDTPTIKDVINRLSSLGERPGLITSRGGSRYATMGQLEDQKKLIATYDSSGPTKMENEALVKYFSALEGMTFLEADSQVKKLGMRLWIRKMNDETPNRCMNHDFSAIAVEVVDECPASPTMASPHGIVSKVLGVKIADPDTKLENPLRR